MKKIITILSKIFLLIATFQMKYRVIMIVQKQMSYRLQAVKKKRLKKQGNTKENTIITTIERSSSNHTCVEFVEKLFPTALI